MAKKEGAVAFLREWTVHYVKNKDILTRKIESITEQGEDSILVKAKDREQLYLIRPFVKDMQGALAGLKKENSVNIVLCNTPDNFNAMLKAWESLIAFPKLTIIFVNPFSQLDTKWVLIPHTHDLISERESLKLGLKTMFEMVEPTNEEEFARRIASASEE